jgi:hypothetical protein
MRRILVLTMLLMLAVASISNAATIVILNNDGAGEGFNDPTPAAPVGGNPGTTVGAQRLNVFQKAADIWGGLLPSAVTIVIRAQFDPQTCTASSAVLGSASASEIYRNFAGAPIANTWYNVAEANKLAGVDLNPALYDINATFNSNLNGQASCLGGIGWYLGFDGLEGTNIELLPVVLHEMGHGLGFTANLGSTGVEPGTPPSPTVFERFIHDNTVNLQWDAMTAAQRAVSALNTNNVVFTGPCTTAHAPYVLSPGTQKMWINSSTVPLNPYYLTGSAAFGPTSYSVTGNLVLADDGAAPNSDGCTPLVNGGAIAGNIAVIDRGTCTFVAKAQAAEAAGATACVIVNNAAGSPAPGLGGAGVVNIPTVSVTLADGNAIKAAMLGGTVNATLGFDLSQLAGADPLNHVQLYTPNPFQSGSSISHWDVSAFPNLLMEPAINNNLSSTVDLTFWVFGDIGWHDVCNSPVPVAISIFNAFPTSGGVKLQAQFYSSLADAKFVNVYRADRGEDFRMLTTVNAPEDGKFTYMDNAVVSGGAYRYKIGVIEGDNEYFSAIADIRLPGVKISLAQNVPNPFNPETTIRFSLPSSARVTLSIYSASGALVRTLVDGVQPSGNHDFTWNGTDARGNAVSSGVYFYRLNAGKFNETKKMVLLK